jgi:hypothetical protein
MQGSTGGTSVPFNAIPYGEGHVPPLSPSLSGTFQQPIGSNVNYILFGVGSIGPSSYTTPMGSMSFTLFDVFGNNDFSSAIISFGGNPSFGQQNPMLGTIPAQGESTRVLSSQGIWNSWQGSIPLQGMMARGNPFHGQWNLEQGLVPMPIRLVRGNVCQNPWNTTQGSIPTQSTSYNYRSQPMIFQQMNFLYVVQIHNFYQNPGE